MPALLAELRALGLLERTLFVDNGSSDGGAGADRARPAARSLREPRRGLWRTRASEASVKRGREAPLQWSSWRPTGPTIRRRCVISSVRSSPALPTSSSARVARPCAVDRRGPHAAGTSAWATPGWLSTMRLFFGLRLSDDGPFRAVRLDLLDRLALEERAYAFPTEMAVKARLAGARIGVRQVAYRPRSGTSKIAGSWRASLGAVRDISWCLGCGRCGWSRLGPSAPSKRAGAASDSPREPRVDAQRPSRPAPGQRQAAGPP